MRQIRGLVLALFFSTLVFAQDSSSKTVSTDEKAMQILARAKRITAVSTELSGIKRIFVGFSSASKAEYKFRNEPIRSETITKEEYSCELPDKIKIKIDANVSNVFRGEESNNDYMTETIRNGDSYFEDTAVFADGQRIGVPTKTSTKEENLEAQKYFAFTRIFPIVYYSDWFSTVDFKYVGKSEIKNVKVDMLEAFLKNKTTFRLFFDEKTGQLLMLKTHRVDKSNVNLEESYLFSDFREEAGLHFAHKISMQSSDEQIGMSEIIIKSIKINPIFKPNFFDVKK